MTLKLVLKALRDEGLAVSSHQVGYALLCRAIPPVQYDGAGNRTFTEKHIVALRNHFSTPRPKGRKAS
jgi:hypothetical protein